MTDHVQADQCLMCGSAIYVKLIPPSEPMPDPVYTCRCRQVYPDRFRVENAGQHGYGRTGRAGIRR